MRSVGAIVAGLFVIAACDHHGSPSSPDAAASTADAAGSSAGDAWVDPLGTDDAQHGRGPGAQAFRTITYALAHATATIHVDAGTYDAAGGETFPIALTGTQTLSCADVLVSHIVGDGPAASSADATVTLGGSANTVQGCDIAGTGTVELAECIQITANGPHKIIGDTLHACPIVLDLGGASGVTIRDVTAGDVSTPTVENCIEQAGDDLRIESFSCSAGNDWLFVCGANLSGCGTNVNGRVAACSYTADLSGPCS